MKFDPSIDSSIRFIIYQLTKFDELMSKWQQKEEEHTDKIVEVDICTRTCIHSFETTIMVGTKPFLQLLVGNDILV